MAHDTLPTGNTLPVGTIPRAILEDRWEGLFTSDDGTSSSEHVGEGERRYMALVETLSDIVARVSRHRSPEDDISQDGIVDEVYAVIREAILSRIDEKGYAR